MDITRLPPRHIELLEPGIAIGLEISGKGLEMRARPFAFAVERWTARGTDMPRRREGLNDPLRLSTIVHLTLAMHERFGDALVQSAADIIRPLLDHKAIALDIALDELLGLIPVWRMVCNAAIKTGLPDLNAVADALVVLLTAVDVECVHVIKVVALSDRSYHFATVRPTA
jgi:hypothetical protein